MNTLECERIYKGHKHGILQVKLHVVKGTCSQLPICTQCSEGLDSLLMFSSSQDGQIKGWEISMGVQILSIDSHSQAVTCLQFENNILHSLSMSGGKYCVHEIGLVFQRLEKSKNNQNKQQQQLNQSSSCDDHYLKFQGATVMLIQTSDFEVDFSFDSCLFANRNQVLIGTNSGKIFCRDFGFNVET
eukprot:TRINITY_DN14515_c0_g1_i4.p3 TRINITY_DN14515_c0_g1~~TRINITY_DN14515_c0_g1_i4.p3  ORF type:complete len:187 (-),score=21.86 TRINITY_DN14515_c0_g1_i4:740-1300(-)